MQLPCIIKRIGRMKGENRIYIEDYVYSHLKKLNEKICNGIVPMRIALYGCRSKKEDRTLYFIYGAICVMEELEYNRTPKQIQETFFKEYEIIGYVNLYGKKQETSGKEGYYIFYEANEPMQKYLLSYYELRNQQKIQKEEKEEEQQKLSDLEMTLWQMYGIISKKEKMTGRI